LALEGIKSAASATRWANAVAPFAEAYAESERAVLLKALKKMVGWLNYAEEQDHWYFAEEQAPKFHADKAEAEAAIRKAEHDGL